MKLVDFDDVLYSFTSREFGANLAFHVDDDPLVVDQNHLILSKQLGFDKESLVYMKQVHSDKVYIVSLDDGYATPPTCDALVTNRVNVPLMVMVADCTPVLFYDPIGKAIGVAHVGRAGAFLNIIKNTIYKMQEEFGTDPKDIVVSIGPAIGVCCYEVGEKIYEEAKDRFHYAFQKDETRYLLDVNSIVLRQLLLCGIDTNNIENEKICTACNTDKFFSYRREGKTGRFSGILMIKG